MTRAVVASQLPLEQQHAAMTQIEQAMAQHWLLPPSLWMDLDRLTMGHLSAQAHVRSALVAVAAERFRLKHDRWPQALEALVEDRLLNAVPSDPYDGRPMRWRLLSDAAVVYSVGYDRKDNGGEVMPGNRSPLDVGLRLLHPMARRQPPPG
jgi:hypothetical protein